MSKSEKELLVNEITAKETIEKWLDHKRVKPRKRTAYDQSIQTLEAAVEDGELTLDEKTHELRYKLLFPLENEIKTTELVFKPRMNDKLLKPKLKGCAPTDVEGRTNGYISALTNQPVNLIESIDTEDKDVCSAIAVFFM